MGLATQTPSILSTTQCNVSAAGHLTERWPVSLTVAGSCRVPDDDDDDDKQEYLPNRRNEKSTVLQYHACSCHDSAHYCTAYRGRSSPPDHLRWNRRADSLNNEC